MATYADLDINQRINFRAALQAWARYSIQHFQEQLDKKVYRVRSRRGRTARSGRLRQAWWQNIQTSSSGLDRVMIQFMLYGRFVDMGVGRGTSATDRAVHRILRLGRTGRQRKPWYSKRKGYEIKRLREILAAQHIHIALESVENLLTASFTRTI